jgi:hypothetical protein
MKTTLVFALLAALLLAGSVSSEVLSINNPAPNEVISETARIRLSVSSTETSSGCYFNYNNVRNVSVDCNGTTLVNLPNADGVYQLNVGDSEGTGVTQYVIVKKPTGAIVVLVYTLGLGLMLALLFLLFRMIIRTALLEYNVYDLFTAWGVLFAYMITYQLMLEYVNASFIIGWADLFMNYGGFWILTTLSTTSYAICAIARATRKKRPGDPREGWLR